MKKKKERYYRCQVCEEKFAKLALLNSHYKENDSPLHCKTCEKYFNTPSALEHHSYLHKELKYKCEKCGAGFPFVSSKQAHMITHLKDPQHKCKEAKCNKAFFNKGDLVKHAKIHTNDKLKCSMCEYSTYDGRSLKAYMRKHSNLKRYLCMDCLSLFKYHFQLARHLSCKNVKTEDHDGSKPPKGSQSPEY